MDAKASKDNKSVSLRRVNLFILAFAVILFGFYAVHYALPSFFWLCDKDALTYGHQKSDTTQNIKQGNAFFWEPTPNLSLSKQLSGVVFENFGIVRETDRFAFSSHSCHYLEAHNVSGPYVGWSEVGTCFYKYRIAEGGILSHPALGVRSAVPLGGIAAGVFELRADGKFHDWTIFNQHPAGAAKFGVIEDMFMAIRTQDIDGNISRILQTNPRLPKLADYNVPSLEYRGTYPVSKLCPRDPMLPVDVCVYAYFWYKHGDMNTSATPAVAFTATLTNPTDREVETSFMINLPIGMELDTTREKPQMPSLFPHTKKRLPVSFKLDAKPGLHQPSECMKMCKEDCFTWHYDPFGEVCYIHFDQSMMNGHKEGHYSGVKSKWSTHKNCLTINRDTPGYNTNGNVSLCVFSDDDNVSITHGTSNNLTALWKDFVDTGSISSKGGIATGAVAGSVTLEPQETKEVTVTLGWYFPEKDFLGLPIGNFYTNLVKDSHDAATYLGSNREAAVQDILKLHSSFLVTDLPNTLEDILINSLSHIRSAFWLEDGRWRQWEALDCVNLDSIHNDGERHIPYLFVFPDSTISKLRAWAQFQRSDGMLQEELRCGCWDLPLEPVAVEFGCGREMSDSSSMFIVYLLELLQLHPSNETNEVVSELWPNAKRAAQWHMSVSNETGLPKYLTTTYDVLHLNSYPYAAYSSAFHLLAMKAAEKLARWIGDNDFAEECKEAFLWGQDAFDETHWNETAQYYNAYNSTEEEFDKEAFFVNDLRLNLCAYPEYHREEWGECVEGYPTTPGAIMTDTFYAQVLAYLLGLGTLVKDEERLRKHMDAELRKNDRDVGMIVLSGRYFTDPQPYTDNAVWMMGNANWATIQLHLGMNWELAMSVGVKVLDIYRHRLHDTWNVAGVLGGYGYNSDVVPYITSHYGYYMSAWHMVLALSGQQFDANNKTLSFHPKKRSPFRLPFMLPTVWGVLESTIEPLQNSSMARVMYALHLEHGELELSKLYVMEKPVQRKNNLCESKEIDSFVILSNRRPFVLECQWEY